tara:strand:- start:605 stop:850 length:246 start_codon:yes stop_codon:yes gene_type:complete
MIPGAATRFSTYEMVEPAKDVTPKPCVGGPIPFRKTNHNAKSVTDPCIYSNSAKQLSLALMTLRRSAGLRSFIEIASRSAS